MDIINSNRVVYTPSQFAKSNLIYLQEVGFLQYLAPHTSRREQLHSFLFFIVLEGRGSISYHDTSYQLKPGDCVFLDCRFPYTQASTDELWKLAWIHFNGTNMDTIYEKFLERCGGPCFFSGRPEVYTALHEEIFALSKSEEHVRDMKLMEKLTSLLVMIMENSWKKGHHAALSRARRELQPIKHYLEENYAKEIRLEQLADDFFINKFYLTRIFREQYGLSINQYLIQLRITHAKQLLRFSSLSVAEIGIQCGMDDANYFARTFKKVEGVSPMQFRKEWSARES